MNGFTICDLRLPKAQDIAKIFHSPEGTRCCRFTAFCLLLPGTNVMSLTWMMKKQMVLLWIPLIDLLMVMQRFLLTGWLRAKQTTPRNDFRVKITTIIPNNQRTKVFVPRLEPFECVSEIKSQPENRTECIHIIDKSFLIGSFVIIN